MLICDVVKIGPNFSCSLLSQIDNETCTANGRTYRFGSHFKIDCNYCMCGPNGTVACTKRLCLKPSEYFMILSLLAYIHILFTYYSVSYNNGK